MGDPTMFYSVPLPFTKDLLNTFIGSLYKSTHVPAAMVLAATATKSFLVNTVLGAMIIISARY